MSYDADRQRKELVRESVALIREVDDGTNATADPELVRLARGLLEANERKNGAVEEGLAAISRIRAEGGTPEEQEEAAAPHMDELHAAQADMDAMIGDLAKLAPAEA